MDRKELVFYWRRKKTCLCWTRKKDWSMLGEEEACNLRKGWVGEGSVSVNALNDGDAVLQRWWWQCPQETLSALALDEQRWRRDRELSIGETGSKEPTPSSVFTRGSIFFFSNPNCVNEVGKMMKGIGWVLYFAASKLWISWMEGMMKTMVWYR